MNHNETASIALSGEFPNEVIRASAGTGKTFELSNRYLRLLASGVECNSILATTFTRKGAGEILDRIIGRLSAAALNDEDAQELSEQLRWKLTAPRAAEILRELLQNLHRLEIGTLDSFFNRFAKAFSLELGLPATWEIVEQQLINRLQDQAIQKILYSETAESLMHLMAHGEANRRIATEVRDTVKHLYEVFSESTPEAWEKIPRQKGRLDEDALAKLSESLPDVELPDLSSWRTAWNKLAQRLVDKEWEKIVSDGIVGKIAAGETKYQRREIPENVRVVADKILQHCAAEMTQQLAFRNIATRNLLKLFADEFEQLKSNTGQLRFEDVTARLAKFIESINTDGLAFRLDNQVRHLLLDEFQDTSPAQWNVMSPFAQRVTEVENASTSFFCVGDIKQAIFGWRGGAADIFDRVENELPNLVDTEPRTKSWRSSPAVIDFVNHIFQNLDRFQPDPKKYQRVAKAVHAWRDWFEKHETNRTDLAGCATVEIAPNVDGLNGKLDANESLLKTTVMKVQCLNNQLPDSKTIGVLVRKNAEVGEIIFRLKQLGIDASEEGGNPLTDSAAVEVVLSALKLADSPGDSLARFHVSHSALGPHFGIDQQDDTNASECQKQAEAASKHIRRELLVRGYGACIETLARILADTCTEREIARLQQLVQVAYSAESGRDTWQLRPIRFVNFIRDEYRAFAPSAARIRVMTVHKSKGLEFDAVVVPLRSGRGDQLVGLPPKVVIGRPSPTESIDVVTRHVSKETQVLLPKPIQKLFENQESLVIREAMCLLYVALTRSVQATHVILSPDTKCKSATAASVVLSAFSEKDRDDNDLRIHQSGNLDWHLSSTEVETKDRETSDANLDAFYLPCKAKLKQATISRDIRSGRGVANRYPSEQRQTKGETIGHCLKTNLNHRAMKLGSLLHRCFEQVAWLDEFDSRNLTFLRDELRKIDSDPERIGSAIENFESAIAGQNIKRLLTRSEQFSRFSVSELVVLTEHRFAVSTASGLLSGSIDRLILGYSKGKLASAEIIDFKSDPVSASDAAARAESYRSQLDAYREATATMFDLQLKKIRQTVAFVNADLILSLDDHNELSVSDQREPEKRKPVDDSGQQKTLW